MSSRTRLALALAAPLALAVASVACSSAGPSASPSPEDVGELSAALSSVPSTVACIDLQFASGDRVIDRQTSVWPGQGGANLHFTGLPLGSVVLSGLAYAVTCAAVTATTNADYATNPLTISLVPGQTASVGLQFHAAGSVLVGIGFDDAGVQPWIVASSGSAYFGGGSCGTTTATQSFTFTNQGSAPTKTLTTTISNNTNASRFVIPAGGDTCAGKSLGVNASCSVGVYYQLSGCNNLNPSSSLTIGDGSASASVALSGSFG